MLHRNYFDTLPGLQLIPREERPRGRAEDGSDLISLCSENDFQGSPFEFPVCLISASFIVILISFVIFQLPVIQTRDCVYLFLSLLFFVSFVVSSLGEKFGMNFFFVHAQIERSTCSDDLLISPFCLSQFDPRLYSVKRMRMANHVLLISFRFVIERA